MEAIMRLIAVGALAIAILVSGMVSYSAPRASAPEPTGVTIDTNAMQSTIDTRSMPEQQVSDLF
jgi:hypothetical protein